MPSSMYTKVSKIIKIFELSEEAKIEIYTWAKKRRRELNLEDTIFNINNQEVVQAYHYKELNKKISKEIL